MSQTIDLITHNALRELRSFTRETGQPTAIDEMDLAPIENVQKIEIDEEHLTITYNQKISHRYNAKEITQREWEYKYNDDVELRRRRNSPTSSSWRRISHVRDLSGRTSPAIHRDARSAAAATSRS